MTEKRIKPFGLWPSPIRPANLAQSLRLSDVAWDDDGETLVWLEGRSDQGVLVCATPGSAPRDLTPTLNVRARVGYGGGDFGVRNGYVYFVAKEGRIYRQRLAAGAAEPVTPQFGHMAAPTPSPDGQWVVFVHTYEGVDGLAIVDAAGTQWPQKMAYGADFYMQPCWHPEGTHLAWVSWDHPHMPWDQTRLHMAAVDTRGEGLPTLKETKTLVDKPEVAIFQPQFSPDGTSLVYVCDESGWSNLYRYDLETGEHCQLTHDRAEVSRPAWAQGSRTYGFSPRWGRIYYLRNEAGFFRVWTYDLPTGKVQPFQSPLLDYTQLSQIAVDPQRGTLAFTGSSSTFGERVISYRPGRATRVTIWQRSTDESTPEEDLSRPRPVWWSAPDGTVVHGLYYPPASSRYAGRGLPPAIIHVHGGPTGQADAGYNARAQFFATRGYGYMEVNYRGSTGYGKEYMTALRGQWGILDVEDAIGGAQHLVDAGMVDPSRLVIMGGSAGGYSVLRALADYPGFFRAAICLYGVSNLFTLAADTHKFEERYLDSLIGTLPDDSDLYRERSPIFFASQIVDPIAIFQGQEDRVVPKSQSDEIVASLEQRGIAHAYHVYEGEGHGWRKRETIEAFYEAVEAFLEQQVIFR